MNTQFNQLAELYDRSVDEMPFRRAIEIPSVLDAVGDLAGKRALDLGCGSGLYTRILAARGAESVTGLDESEGMISYARAREEAAPLGVEYIVQDAAGELDSALHDNYHLVLAVYVLQYAPTFEALCQLCSTVRAALRDGGRFVTAALNPDLNTRPGYYHSFCFDLEMPPRPRDGDPSNLITWFGTERSEVTLHFWTRETQEEALGKAGFCDITWRAPHCAAAIDPTPFADYLAHPHTVILTAE